MKVVFLDMDGVLNNVEQMVAKSRRGSTADAACLDPTAVGLVKFICEMTGARIVISSTWRLLHKSPDWFNGMFESYGWWENPVIGITDDLPGPRGKEIAKYVNENGIFNYVILDDDSDMLPDQPFVHVDNVTGITLYDAIDACEILGVLPSNVDRYNEIKEHVDFKRRKKNDNAN